MRAAIHGKTSEEQSFVDREVWALFCSFVGESRPCMALYSLVRCMYMSPGFDKTGLFLVFILFILPLLFAYFKTNVRTFPAKLAVDHLKPGDSSLGDHMDGTDSPDLTYCLIKKLIQIVVQHRKTNW